MGPVRDLIGALRDQATGPAAQPAQPGAAPPPHSGFGSERHGRQSRGRGGDRPKLIKGVLNPRFWTESEYRHWYVEGIMESRMGRVISMLPFIFVMALASTSTQLCLWLAFGFCLGLLILNGYRSRYNPKLSWPMALEIGQLIAYTILIILDYRLAGFTYILITPIIVSAIFGMMLGSMLICRPFTLQYVAKTMTEAEWHSKEVFRAHMFIAGLWTFALAICTICVWCAYHFFAYNTSGAGYVVLMIVVPIVIPLGMVLVTSYFRRVKEAQKSILQGIKVPVGEEGYTEPNADDDLPKPPGVSPPPAAAPASNEISKV